MCVCVCIYIYIYIYTYMHVYTLFYIARLEWLLYSWYRLTG